MTFFKNYPGIIMIQKGDLVSRQNCNFSTMKNTETKIAHLLVCYTDRLRERSGSVVECLTGDQGAAGSSLIGVTALCP